MARRHAVILLTAVALAGPACGGDGSGVTASNGAPSDLGRDEAAFCDAWNAALNTGNEAAFDGLLANPPADLEQAAAIVRQANAAGSKSAAADEATDEVLNWTELHCRQGGGAESQRRVAPPPGAEVNGLTFCGTTTSPRPPDDGRSGMALYGEAGAEDPYDGPMLGVLWNPRGDHGDGSHAGDGAREAVTVRGRDGVAAPITVFQQVVLPDLGTVVAWTEGDRSLGLYGRQWSIDRADELVAIAERLEEVDGRFRLPDDALPDGYAEVFAGSQSVTGLIVSPPSRYSVRYQGPDGLLTLSGLHMTEDEFEAFRFFTIGVDRDEVADRDALAGNAWHQDGPAVVTWHEPDGLVVRIVGIGVPLDAAERVAGEARELTSEEWVALVEGDSAC